MAAPSVVIGSLFRDSSSRGELKRYIHQVESVDWDGPVRVIAMHGDSSDDTLEHLHRWQSISQRVKMTIIHRDTGEPNYGSVVNIYRFAHLAEIANQVVEEYRGEDYFMWMESDIIWKPNLFRQFSFLDKDVQAPMVLHEGRKTFYDTWAYRQGTIQVNPLPDDYGPGCFAWMPPYHPCYSPVQPFQVDTAGTCLWVSKRVMETDPRFTQEEAIVGYCKQVVERGWQIWVNPRVTIWHPFPSRAVVTATNIIKPGDIVRRKSYKGD